MFAHRAHTHFIPLIALLPLLAACADSASPTAIDQAPVVPGTVVTPSTLVEERPTTEGVLRQVIDGLTRDVDAPTTRGLDSSWTIDARGRTRTFTARGLREELERLTDRTRHSSFGILADGDPKLSLTAYGIVQVADNHFHFISMSVVNRMDVVYHRMKATAKVVGVGENGAQAEVFNKTDSVNFYASGGIATHAWNDFVISDGCSFTGSLGTNNEALWPATGFVPSGATDRAFGWGGGLKTMWRSCPKPATAAPPPPESLCDDEASLSCPPTNGGGAATYGSAQLVREIGRSGGYKTVCYVTDWYENGVYVETTIDRCWTEPIY